MFLELRVLYFEDLAVGDVERHAKSVAASDVVGFAEATGDRNPIHLSEKEERGQTPSRRWEKGSDPFPLLKTLAEKGLIPLATFLLLQREGCSRAGLKHAA